MNTPETRLVRSIQKYVFKRPAQARLPAERPVGADCVLIRKLRPQPLRIPGNHSTSLESGGLTRFMTGTSGGGVWVWGISLTGSRRRDRRAVLRPPCPFLFVKLR